MSRALAWAQQQSERPRLPKEIVTLQGHVQDDGNFLLTVQGHGTVIIPHDHCLMLARFLLEQYGPDGTR